MIVRLTHTTPMALNILSLSADILTYSFCNNYFLKKIVIVNWCKIGYIPENQSNMIEYIIWRLDKNRSMFCSTNFIHKENNSPDRLNNLIIPIVFILKKEKLKLKLTKTILSITVREV